MLRDCFDIARKGFGDLFQRHPVALKDQQQNIKPPMIGRPLEISLQLLCCFHEYILPQHSYILKNVGMFIHHPQNTLPLAAGMNADR